MQVDYRIMNPNAPPYPPLPPTNKQPGNLNYSQTEPGQTWDAAECAAWRTATGSSTGWKSTRGEAEVKSKVGWGRLHEEEEKWASSTRKRNSNEGQCMHS